MSCRLISPLIMCWRVTAPHRDSLLPCCTRNGRTASWRFQGGRGRGGLWLCPQGGCCLRCWPSCRSLYRQQGRGNVTRVHSATSGFIRPPPSPSGVSRVWSVLGPLLALVCPLRWCHVISPAVVNPQRCSSKEHILGTAHSRSTKVTSSMATRPSKPERSASKISWKHTTGGGSETYRDSGFS